MMCVFLLLRVRSGTREGLQCFPFCANQSSLLPGMFCFIFFLFFDFCFSGAVGVGDTAPVACRPRPDVLLRAASRCRYSLQQNPGHPRHAPADGTGKPGGQKRTDRTINMHILVHPRFRSKFRDNLQLCCF